MISPAGAGAGCARRPGWAGAGFMTCLLADRRSVGRPGVEAPTATPRLPDTPVHRHLRITGITRVSAPAHRHDRASCLSWSGARGHVSGEDVVGVAVEILAGSVIAHRRPRVSGWGRDLHVAQVHARVEHGRDEGVP